MIDLESEIENKMINESIEEMEKRGKVNKALSDYSRSNRKIRNYGVGCYELDVEDGTGIMDTFATFKNPRLSKPYFTMLFTAMIRAPKLFVELDEANNTDEFDAAVDDFYQYVKSKIEDI